MSRYPNTIANKPASKFVEHCLLVYLVVAVTLIELLQYKHVL